MTCVASVLGVNFSGHGPGCVGKVIELPTSNARWDSIDPVPTDASGVGPLQKDLASPVYPVVLTPMLLRPVGGNYGEAN
jgi:hypothetical protein